MGSNRNEKLTPRIFEFILDSRHMHEFLNFSAEFRAILFERDRSDGSIRRSCNSVHAVVNIKRSTAEVKHP